MDLVLIAANTSIIGMIANIAVSAKRKKRKKDGVEKTRKMIGK